jgi:hypothetical protein
MATLPTRQEVENTFKGLNTKPIVLRNNQYIVTICVTDYMKAHDLADTFGNADSIQRQKFVKINIGTNKKICTQN